MQIDSWTSEGMDWTSIDSLRLKALAPHCEAVRKAVAERLLAKMNMGVLSSSSSPAVEADALSDENMYDGVFGPDFELRLHSFEFFAKRVQSAVDALLDSFFLDVAAISSDGSSRTLDAQDIEGSALYSGKAFSALPRLTQARALTLIQAEKRLPVAPLSPVAEWLRQQYLLLNLMNSVVLSPGYSSSAGGRRYFVELSPWNSELYGSYTETVLAWAGITDFDSALFEELGWDYITASNAVPSAWAGAGYISGKSRRHAWRNWLKYKFDFSKLVDAGLDFSLLACQMQAKIPDGLGCFSPIVRTFSTETLHREGYSAVECGERGSGGILEMELGKNDNVPAIPAPPDSGDSFKGWELSSAPGPFLAKFAFSFTADA